MLLLLEKKYYQINVTIALFINLLRIVILGYPSNRQG
jgi:hypothetical protein